MRPHRIMYSLCLWWPRVWTTSPTSCKQRGDLEQDPELGRELVQIAQLREQRAGEPPDLLAVGGVVIDPAGEGAGRGDDRLVAVALVIAGRLGLGLGQLEEDRVADADAGHHQAGDAELAADRGQHQRGHPRTSARSRRTP
jgi:hypothetical protein